MTEARGHRVHEVTDGAGDRNRNEMGIESMAEPYLPTIVDYEN